MNSTNEMSPTVLRKLAENWCTPEGAQSPAFYLNWAADRIDLQKNIIDYMWKAFDTAGFKLPENKEFRIDKV